MTATLAPPLEKPRRIGHLVLGRELGTTGVASVWTARDESKGSAAVTVLRVHPAIATLPEPRARVVAAARKGLLIRHPNVLTSRDVVEDGAELAVVCEPFEGILFRELSLEGPARGIPLPINVLTRVTLEVLAGLEAAHGNANDEDWPEPFTPCDLSPDAIVLTAEGEAKLVTLTLEQAVPGNAPGRPRETLAYQAPERLDGGTADPRADVWGCGVMLWEGATQRQLFGGDDPVEAVRRRSIPRLDEIGVRAAGPLPAKLSNVIARALGRVPGSRFSSADHLGRALLEAAGGQVSAPAEIGALVARCLQARALSGASGRTDTSVVRARSPVSPPREKTPSLPDDKARVPAPRVPSPSSPSSPDLRRPQPSRPDLAGGKTVQLPLPGPGGTAAAKTDTKADAPAKPKPTTGAGKTQRMAPVKAAAPDVVEEVGSAEVEVDLEPAPVRPPVPQAATRTQQPAPAKAPAAPAPAVTRPMATVATPAPPVAAPVAPVAAPVAPVTAPVAPMTPPVAPAAFASAPVGPASAVTTPTPTPFTTPAARPCVAPAPEATSPAPVPPAAFASVASPFPIAATYPAAPRRRHPVETRRLIGTAVSGFVAVGMLVLAATSTPKPREDKAEAPPPTKPTEAPRVANPSPTTTASPTNEPPRGEPARAPGPNDVPAQPGSDPGVGGPGIGVRPGTGPTGTEPAPAASEPKPPPKRRYNPKTI